MYAPSSQVAVYPFTRQPEGEEIVIGRTDTGVFLSLPREAVEILDWLREGRTVAPAELVDFLRGRFPDWWLPEDVVFVPAIPRTSTGKFLKSALRDSLRGHYGGA